MSDISLGQSSPTTTLGYTYDGYGRLSAITKDSDTARTYTYTTGGFKVDYMTDYLELDTSSTAQMQTDYTYNSLGLVSGISYIDTAPATDVTKESYTYTYDDRGYILTETLNTNYSGTNTVNKSYTYDGIGRLETSTEGSTTTTYTYDAVGNRLTQSIGTASLVYAYNEFNQLDYINKNGALRIDYEYNERGVQTSEAIANGATTSYSYDAAGRLAKTVEGSNITKHFYNRDAWTSSKYGVSVTSRQWSKNKGGIGR